jgi:Flp pilus assembly protein TadD
MDSFRFIQLTIHAVILATTAPGCSQLPSFVQRAEQTEAAAGNSYSPGNVQFGEDPDAADAPADPEQRRDSLLLTQARLSLADGDEETAAQVLDSILESNPHCSEASHLLGVLETRTGDVEAAGKHFQAALAADRDNAQLNCDYGYFCYLIDRWDDAEHYLTRAIEIDPALAEAQTNLGMLEARLGKTESARQHFREAGCTEAEMLNNLAFARLLEDDVTAAESTYRQALIIDPEQRHVQHGLQLASHMSDAGRQVAAAASSAPGTARVND